MNMASIVIIEDDAHSGRLAAKILRNAGHQVRLLETGEDGLTVVIETHPDVLLIDLGLPDIDGQTVIALLRQQPEMANIVILAYTGWPQETAYEMATAYGCDGVIIKPIDTRTFAAQVESYVNLHKR
jgi:CheY-like chemotaxis protein